MTTAFRYTVLSGDTLATIAEGVSASAGVTYQAIQAANPSVPPTGLQIGMLLNIPAKAGSNIVLRYTVMSGDSYSQIATQLARCAGVTDSQIAAGNPNINPSLLTVGQVVNIPVAGSAPAPSPVPVPGAEYIGFWYWTWGDVTRIPPGGCNIGLAFSGSSIVDEALQTSATIYNSVPDAKYLTFAGGGKDTGWISAASLQGLTDAINQGKLSDYVGIAYDIEKGDAGLATAFAESFAAAKAKGFKVLVTISHSAPYEVADAYDLMQSFFTNPNIDFLSPQLYTSGTEPQNDYTTSQGVTWEMYASAKAKVIPSISYASMYADAQAYFAQQGVKLAGFVQWSQC